MPEVASLPLQPTPTGWLYHPLKSGARDRPAATPVGGSASILRFLVVIVVSPPALLAQQVRVVPAFGPLTWMAGSQPELSINGPSGSLADQCTTMKLPWLLPRYQLLV